MHTRAQTRRKCAHTHFVACARVYASCACVCALTFTKICVVVFENNMSKCQYIRSKRRPISLHRVPPCWIIKIKIYFSSVGSPCRSFQSHKDSNLPNFIGYTIFSDQKFLGFFFFYLEVFWTLTNFLN